MKFHFKLVSLSHQSNTNVTYSTQPKGHISVEILATILEVFA